ncbi:MAG TPA: hypothetical protein VF791_21325 [Pyrinomonadaceae bacterium]
MFKRGLVIIFCLFVAVTGQGLSADAFAQAQNAPRAEVTVTLNEQFFNALLETIFTRMKAPSFPLSLASSEPDKAPAGVWESKAVTLSHSGPKPDACESSVVLERETNGVRTAVRFENGRVAAPLAFRGSYSIALIGCVNFQGWADTVIQLNFDRERQVLSARVTVVNIELNNIPSLASGMVIRLVQNSIDRRINPIEILQATQLSTRLPITGTGGALRMRATEIRPEVVPGALSLHIYYEFAPAE